MCHKKSTHIFIPFGGFLPTVISQNSGTRELVIRALEGLPAGTVAAVSNNVRSNLIFSAIGRIPST
jgi:hypothetical protein